MTGSTNELKNALELVDRTLKEVRPHVHKLLQPGAGAGELKDLSQHIFGGLSLPEELTVWFGWHNGQEGYDPPSPDNNLTLLPIRMAIECWDVCNDPETMRPWSRSWLPLFENGAGDYWVYETEGKKAGSLIAYWHDEKSRTQVFESLTAWASDLVKVLKTAGR